MMLRVKEPVPMLSRLPALLRRRLFHLWFLLRRPMTLGVRALVLDGSRVLLVRHTYVRGWHLPGGGVDPGETALMALGRELLEETGLAPASPPHLRSVHLNRQSSRRDHVLLFHVAAWREARRFAPSREIAECRFFALDDLPADLHASSRRRIEEALGHCDISPFW